MAKELGTTSSFVVEPTDHGWSVRQGTERLGLFLTQRQALGDVRKRRAELKIKGRESTLSVTGSEPQQAPNDRPSRPFWARR
jgi:hypothetical protein